jgi:hypothetical protein
MSQTNNLVVAYALLRRLYQIYDSGGHSMRSLRSNLVEATWWSRPEHVPEVDISYEGLEKLRADIDRSGPIRIPGIGLQELDEPTFLCLVAREVINAGKEECIEVSFTETNILECVLFLLQEEERMKQFEAHGGARFAARDLVSEGRRRLSQDD